jgi:hypothetical protein
MKHNVLMGVAALFLAASAQAGVLIEFQHADQSAGAGGLLSFTGIITNQGSEVVYLNGFNLNLAGNDFTTDGLTDFFANVPLTLAAGASTSNIALFSVAVASPLTDPTDLFLGKYSLTGGTDGEAQDLLGSADFTVSTTPGSATPEPSTLATLLLAVAGFCGRSLYLRRPGRRSVLAG